MSEDRTRLPRIIISLGFVCVLFSLVFWIVGFNGKEQHPAGAPMFIALGVLGLYGAWLYLARPQVMEAIHRRPGWWDNIPFIPYVARGVFLGLLGAVCMFLGVGVLIDGLA
jgi:hypothetical protein